MELFSLFSPLKTVTSQEKLFSLIEIGKTALSRPQVLLLMRFIDPTEGFNQYIVCCLGVVKSSKPCAIKPIVYKKRCEPMEVVCETARVQESMSPQSAIYIRTL